MYLGYRVLKLFQSAERLSLDQVELVNLYENLIQL
jgi:hypothetical protein